MGMVRREGLESVGIGDTLCFAKLERSEWPSEMGRRGGINGGSGVAWWYINGAQFVVLASGNA